MFWFLCTGLAVAILLQGVMIVMEIKDRRRK